MRCSIRTAEWSSQGKFMFWKRKLGYEANKTLTFRRLIKSRLPFAGIIRRLPYSTRFQDKG